MAPKLGRSLGNRQELVRNLWRVLSVFVVSILYQNAQPGAKVELFIACIFIAVGNETYWN